MDGVRSDAYTMIRMPAVVSPGVLDQVMDKYGRLVTERGGRYILDLSNVTHLYSATARLIMHLYGQVKHVEGRMYIVNAGDLVRNALHSLQLDRLVPVYASLLDYDLAVSIECAEASA